MYQTRGYPIDPALARAHRAQRKPSRLRAFLRGRTQPSDSANRNQPQAAAADRPAAG